MKTDEAPLHISGLNVFNNRITNRLGRFKLRAGSDFLHFTKIEWTRPPELDLIFT